MKHRGFTIIELLVVLGIIAVLLAIVVPSTFLARQRARMVICQTNVRAINTSMHVYFEEWRTATLPGGHAAKFGGWEYQLLGGNISKDDFYRARSRPDVTYRVRYCPDTSFQESSLAGSSGTGTAALQWNCGLTSGSYGINAWMQGARGSDDLPKVYVPTRIRNEVTVPTFVDSASHDMRADPDDKPGNLLKPGTNASQGSLTSAAMDRHGMAVNVSFYDGHVEKVDLPNLWMLRWSRDWDRSFPMRVR